MIETLSVTCWYAYRYTIQILIELNRLEKKIKEIRTNDRRLHVYTSKRTVLFCWRAADAYVRTTCRSPLRPLHRSSCHLHIHDGWPCATDPPPSHLPLPRTRQRERWPQCDRVTGSECRSSCSKTVCTSLPVWIRTFRPFRGSPDDIRSLDSKFRTVA